MAKCGYCRSMIIVGGVRDGEERFCNEKCHQGGQLVALSERIDPADVKAAVSQVHQGLCPKCGGTGPVDVTTSHKVWSAVFMTSWSSNPQVCCRSCGRKSQVGGLVFSAVVGWWGFPWGLIMTPVQVGRNLVGLFKGYDPYQPSPELEDAVRMMLASEVAHAAAAQQGDAQA